MAWYLVSYNYEGLQGGFHQRRLAINNQLLFVLGISTDVFEEIEVRGNRAAVRVEASVLKLTELNTLYYRFPVDLLSDFIPALSVTALTTQLLSMGYSNADIAAAFPGGLSTANLLQVINFAQSLVYRVKFDGLFSLIEDTSNENMEKKSPLDVDLRVLQMAAVSAGAGQL
jgi:hypothetical protein